jgi:hypothetical protein
VAEGFIDWASLTEVANSYRGNMRSIYSWAAIASIEVTCGIVHGHQLKVLPNPSNRRMVTKGPHDVLRAALTEYVDNTHPPQSVSDRRLSDVNRWAQENTGAIRELLRQCMTDPEAVYGPRCEFNVWLSTALGDNLEATRLRVGGLFDMSFSKPLAAILEITEDELTEVWRRSQDIGLPRQQGELLDLAKWAHVLSIMFRGRCHDLVARETGLQVLHHPVRVPLLPDLAIEADVTVTHDITNSERFMAQLLWASGFSERQHDARIRLWAENVRLVRMAVQAEAIDLPQRTSEDRALETAVDAARRVGVRTHARLIDECADMLIAMGFGALSSFVVNGWPDMYITLGTYAASKKENFGQRTMRATFENRRRLRQLAETPGRITVRFDNQGWEARR